MDKLAPPPQGQKLYFDCELRGFGVCVGPYHKTYIAQRTVKRRSFRVTIGRHGVITAEQARRDARDLIARMARGENPNAARQKERAMSVTLREAWSEFKAARPLAPQTVKDYGRDIERYLAKWLDRPLAEITGAMVVDEHIAQSQKRSPIKATRAMRTLRTVYNFAMIAHEDLPPNPTIRLSKLRMWRRDRRRRTYVRLDQLPSWYAVVIGLEDDAARDYLRLILFTGMRRSEAMRLRWENVDLIGRTLTVPTTKNGDPLVLPLSSVTVDLLEARRRAQPDSEWVFPGDGRTGHLYEPKRWVAKVARASGVKFGLHDLRRTFITIAESLDLSWYTLKRLLNHRDGRDVTEGYIVLDVERLRKPMQRIADYILSTVSSVSRSPNPQAPPVFLANAAE